MVNNEHTSEQHTYAQWRFFEKSPEIRCRICENLGFLGVELDIGKNAANEAVISKGAGKLSVRVIIKARCPGIRIRFPVFPGILVNRT
jgi:acetamidase/formamidase